MRNDILSEEPGHLAQVMQELQGIVAEILKVEPSLVTPDSRLTEIDHVESIKLLRIAGRIERHFGIELTDEALFRDGTLRTIAVQICSAGQQEHA